LLFSAPLPVLNKRERLQPLPTTTTANNNRQQQPSTTTANNNNCQQQQPPTTTTTTTMTTTATEDQARKRVRITDPSALSTTIRSSVIVDFVTRSFALLPTPIKSLATHFTEKLTKLQNKAHQRSITIEKMAEDDFIPTSARIKFELGATQKVKETATFTTLAVSTK
jgi:hypothetical protein